MDSEYYDRLNEFCKNLGVKLLTPKQVFQIQRIQPTKRNVNVQLGCFHECVVSKLAFKVFEMRSEKCRMCQNSDILELEQLANQDIADGNLTQEQLEELDEDYYTLACLRYKAKSQGLPLSDLVDIWLTQGGNCARCECELYPTASTRSFYFVEMQQGDEDSLVSLPDDVDVDHFVGGFVCSVCRD